MLTRGESRWFGAPFPEYLQIDLSFHTGDESRRAWYEKMNHKKNKKKIHEYFCNTLSYFHALSKWPAEPHKDALIIDETRKGPNIHPVPQKTIMSNMVNKTGLRDP